jgi:hypothetical protein
VVRHQSRDNLAIRHQIISEAIYAIWLEWQKVTNFEFCEMGRGQMLTKLWNTDAYPRI